MHFWKVHVYDLIEEYFVETPIESILSLIPIQALKALPTAVECAQPSTMILKIVANVAISACMAALMVFVTSVPIHHFKFSCSSGLI